MTLAPCRSWPLLLAAVALGCSDSFEDSELGVRVRPVAAFPIPDEMTHSQSVEAAVEVQGKDSVALQDVTVTWHSSNDQVVRATPTSTPLHAQLTATGVGEAEITVSVGSGIGNVPDSVLVDTVRVHERWIAVSVGRVMACGINVDSTAYCWDAHLEPEAVPGLFDFAVSNLEVGHNSACVVALTLTPFCWGQNSTREMGLGNQQDQPVAVRAFLNLVPFSLKRMSGRGNVFCLTVKSGFGDGSVDCYGNATFRQLAGPGTLEQCQFDNHQNPCGVGSFFMVSDSVSAGESHVCAIQKAGFPFTPLALICWGADVAGQLGPRGPDAPILRCPDPMFGNSDPGVPCGDPAEVAVELQFASVSAGWDIFTANDEFGFDTPWLGEGHTCAITMAGQAYCWGKDDYGQLGAPADSTCERALFLPGRPPTFACRAQYQPIEAPGKFLAISTGAEHTCGILEDHRIYCWGRNTNGQLGDGSSVDSRMSPAPIASERTYSLVSAGPGQTCGLSTPEGIIDCWGEGLAPTPTRLADPR